MIEARNAAGARQAVQDLQAKFPEWAPPPDLLRAVTLGEAQNNFDSALAKGDFAGAVAVGQSSPALMRCDRINNPWRLAEGQAATGDRATAIGVYRDLVGTCNDFQLVVASIEKTRAIATDGQLISVIDVARERFPYVRVFSIRVPEAILRERLLARGRETADAVEARVARAGAFEVAGDDVVEIVNDAAPAQAIDAFVSILRKSVAGAR